MRNAYRYIKQAGDISTLSPPAARFLMETAREEAATAVLLLLQKTYGLVTKTTNHQHKHAVLQLVKITRALLAQSGVGSIQFIIDAQTSKPVLSAYRDTVMPDGTVLRMTFPTLTKVVLSSNAGQSFLEFLAQYTGTATVKEYVAAQYKEVEKSKNRRNEAIYADCNGIPNCVITQANIDGVRADVQALAIFAAFVAEGVSASFQQEIIPILKACL